MHVGGGGGEGKGAKVQVQMFTVHMYESEDWVVHLKRFRVL